MNIALFAICILATVFFGILQTVKQVVAVVGEGAAGKWKERECMKKGPSVTDRSVELQTPPFCLLDLQNVRLSSTLPDLLQ